MPPAAPFTVVLQQAGAEGAKEARAVCAALLGHSAVGYVKRGSVRGWAGGACGSVRVVYAHGGIVGAFSIRVLWLAASVAD